MSEKEKSKEVLEPLYRFGSVVLRNDKDNRRSLLVELPKEGDKIQAVEVSPILSEEDGVERLGAAGTTDLDRLILVDEEPWSPEKAAHAMVRGVGNPDNQDLINRITGYFEEEAQKPPVKLNQ